MGRQWTVVGIGEALVSDRGGERTATGLAVRVATAAVRLGHEGVAVSRLGQDDAAREVLAQLQAAGVEVAHLQSDPDLPTGRWLPSGAAGASRHRPVRDEAYDNVQWDYDLPDLAQRTDIVVFGALASRHGQTRAVVLQFACERPTALRLIDLTNRPEGRLDRAAIAPLARGADVALVDRGGLVALALAAEQEQDVDAALARLRRRDEIATTLLVDERDPQTRGLRASGAAGADGSVTCPAATLDVAAVAFVAGLRDGLDPGESLRRAARAAGWAAKHPGERVPETVLEAAG